jgi:hypothetical protein
MQESLEGNRKEASKLKRFNKGGERNAQEP